MFEAINQKYKKQRMLAEAKELLKENGYTLLLETPVENFEDMVIQKKKKLTI